MPTDAPSFARRLIHWQKRHGRNDLPWQQTRDPYRVWLSEIMLQQTQVATVVPYYQRFLQAFPDLASLAAAPTEEVMAHWSGLGYYARARNLHACAKAIVAGHGGAFPRDARTITSLPGIGRSTANAIAVFCFAARLPILDGNVKRLLCRHAGIEGWP
ncbi:MAG TPA: A/G-specific adenine glycosylase, partial [Rhodocyclaceae bacterium]|nr:A/G-specific adenine glycosylase [Rhodocyclaceae bacterium]